MKNALKANLSRLGLSGDAVENVPFAKQRWKVVGNVAGAVGSSVPAIANASNGLDEVIRFVLRLRFAVTKVVPDLL
jgi:hypothetical protein